MLASLKIHLATGLLALAALSPLIARANETTQRLKLSEEQIREEMISMTRQLGVTCTTCHDTANFKSDKKDSFKVALEHMRLVKLLRDNGLSGKIGQGPKADCFLCHRGALLPDYKEVVNPLLESPLTAKAKAQESEKQKKKKQQQEEPKAKDSHEKPSEKQPEATEKPTDKSSTEAPGKK